MLKEGTAQQTSKSDCFQLGFQLDCVVLVILGMMYFEEEHSTYDNKEQQLGDKRMLMLDLCP